MLADAEHGLTGKEIGDLLVRLAMADPLASAARPDRLTDAFVARQNKDGSARRIITFIVHAMEPVMCRDRPELFTLLGPPQRTGESLRNMAKFLNYRGFVTGRGNAFQGNVVGIMLRRPLATGYDPV